MSKRKFDKLSETGDGGAGGKAGPKCVAPVSGSGGWAALPPELIRGIGQLQSDARGLAAMERTCRPWRRVVMEGNDDPDIPRKNAMDKVKARPCLWRDLALTQFPRLASLVPVLLARNGGDDDDDDDGDEKNNPHPSPVTSFSWKLQYRAQSLATKDHHPWIYQPKTKPEDYIFSYEFYRCCNFDIEPHLLFVTSGKGWFTPRLWNQELEDIDDDEVPVCKGPLDPELVSRLGTHPFYGEYLDRTEISISVTRISDMKVVELGTIRRRTPPRSPLAGPNTRSGNYTDGDGDLYWGGSNHEEYGDFFVFLPGYSNQRRLRLRLWFTPGSGKIFLRMERVELIGTLYGERTANASELSDNETLLYLERQCPWPES